MVGGFFSMYSATNAVNAGETPSPRPESYDARPAVRALEHEVDRLRLITQALWELLSERAGVSESELEARIREIDLRDGVEDGRMSAHPLRCPQCGRVSSSRHWRCLYCGLEFKRPVAG